VEGERRRPQARMLLGHHLRSARIGAPPVRPAAWNCFNTDATAPSRVRVRCPARRPPTPSCGSPQAHPRANNLLLQRLPFIKAPTVGFNPLNWTMEQTQDYGRSTALMSTLQSVIVLALCLTFLLAFMFW
jgi:hypothetical protein